MREVKPADAMGFPRDAEHKARVLFWGALVLSMLIVVQMVIELKATEGFTMLLRAFLVAILLWSFVLSGYAFHLVSRLVEHSERQGGRFTDPHTGVFTLEYLKSCLDQEYRRALETGVSATVIYVDMRNVERVNHSFGYTVGDIALKALAQICADEIRSGDVLGRVGGDEFLIVLPETNLDQARPVVENIEQAIREYRLDLGKRGVIDYLSCRTGTAVFPADGSNPEDIIAAAHENMAKTAGV